MGFTEKLSTQRLKKHDIIGLENLNVTEIMKSGPISSSLAEGLGPSICLPSRPGILDPSPIELFV
jgi:hypothetical protein